MMIGFFSGLSRIRPRDALPRACTSRTVSAMGASTRSCSSTTGAENAVFPIT